jgi:TPR repeat protein
MTENLETLESLWEKSHARAKENDYIGLLNIWKTLAERGQWTLCARIGLCYEAGRIGVERDTQQALYWYRKAVFECDDPQAHVGLGRMYYDAIGVPRNVLKACEHWEKAYAKQSPDAALYLGLVYYRGFGVGKDIQRAKVYFEFAAQAEYYYAYAHLAYIAFNKYHFIKGVKLLLKGYILINKIMKINRADPRLLGLKEKIKDRNRP